jgi:ankyrin repeat protein
MTDIEFLLPSYPSPAEIEDFCSAATRGDIAAVTALLDIYGDDIINKRDKIDARAITWAAFRGHLDVVRLLLEAGADIDSRGTNEMTGLMWAVQGVEKEVVSFLLEKGASLEEKDNQGRTALMIASPDHPEIAAMIMNHIKTKQAEEEDKKEQAHIAASREASEERIRKLREHRSCGVVLIKKDKPRP